MGEATVEVDVDVEGRRDAFAVSEALIPYHSFLVQLGTEPRVVHARPPGRHGESLEAALRVIDDWVQARDLDASFCRVRGRPNELSRRAA
jgi:hypothetical protein